MNDQKQFIHRFLDTFESHKRLRGGVYFVETMPTTFTGKIARRKVAELASERYNQIAEN